MLLLLFVRSSYSCNENNKKKQSKIDSDLVKLQRILQERKEDSVLQVLRDGIECWRCKDRAWATGGAALLETCGLSNRPPGHYGYCVDFPLETTLFFPRNPNLFIAQEALLD